MNAQFSDRPWDRMEGRYTRPVPPEEQAAIERIADKLVPLCSVRSCDKIAGHDDEHGPVLFTFERIVRG